MIKVKRQKNYFSITFIGVSISCLILGSILPIGYILGGLRFDYSLINLLGFAIALPLAIILFVISIVLFIFSIIKSKKIDGNYSILKLLIPLIVFELAIILTSFILMKLEWY